MRLVPALLALTVICAASPSEAQVVKSPVTQQPNLPKPLALQDTIIISTFDLVRKSADAYELRGSFLGLAPVSYRASVFSDFRDQSTFLSWPSTNVPVWQTSQSSGACGANTVKVAGYFQVRARKSTGRFVQSNVVRDSVCIFFG
jgi:hypothetical protein